MISTHAPAGGATSSHEVLSCRRIKFLLTPLREGRRRSPGFSPGALPISTHAPAGGATACYHLFRRQGFNFYSRPCGRGDTRRSSKVDGSTFISTHAPAGGATRSQKSAPSDAIFLLTPLREGRRARSCCLFLILGDFYSRPCGRGD